MTTLSQPALESYLWGAAVLLRGLVDAGDYKQFVFPLLFYKRLSDVWDEDHAAALAESGGDADYALATANDRFVIPTGAHWSDVRAVAKDVGRALQNALRAIEAANPGKLDGIFGDAPWTNKERLPDVTLKNLLEHLSTEVLSLAHVPEDELGNGYEFLIKKFADDSGHTAQEFYTNRTVVHLMVQLLDPQPGDRIYDPTCGTGGMLISALAEVKRKGGEHRTLRLYGQERNHMTASIARMNLVLHGVEDSEIVRGDTLAAPGFTEHDVLRTFDVVVANPPYSIKHWNREAWTTDSWGRNRFGSPPQSSADLVFVQHIIASMDPRSGRSVTLLPHGFLARDSERTVRAALIQADVIEAVIGLGRRLFFNSGMESCLLICRSQRHPEHRGKILFVDAAHLVSKEGTYNKLLPQHQRAIADAYLRFVPVDGFAAIATLAEVRQAGDSLSINQYLQRKPEEVSVEQGGLSEVWGRLDAGGDVFWQKMDEALAMLDGLSTGEATNA
jgi:type I restriction enzyme M protein